MKKLVLLLFLFVAVFSYAQCTQCGGSRIDIKFSSAIVTDTNGIASTITGDFIYVLDFKQNQCTYIKDGVLQWKVVMQYFGIMEKNKYFVALWNGEKNPALGSKAQSITIDLRSNKCLFKHDIAQLRPMQISASNALISRN